MMKNRLLYLICLAAAAAFFLAYNGWISAYIFYFILFLPVFSLIVSLPGMICTRIFLEQPVRTEKGSEAKTKITVRFPQWLPCGSLRCMILKKNGKKTQKITLRFRDTECRQNRIFTQHCGVEENRILRIRVFDCLGLFALPKKQIADHRTVILPLAVRPEPEPEFQTVESGSFRPTTGTAEIHEIRPFQNGDSLRQVHWKLSAKMDELMLREGQIPEKGLRLVTFLLQDNEEDNDQVLGQVRWIGQTILDNGMDLTLRTLHPQTGERVEQRINDPETLQNALEQLCLLPLPEQPLSPLPDDPQATWQYSVRLKKEETK